MTTNFDDYMRELEARATDDERAMLDKAREAVQSTLDSAERKIKRREQIDGFVAKMVDTYEESSVTRHPWPTDVFNHDGPCVEIRPATAVGCASPR